MLLLIAGLPQTASADPADVDAAARGVVRVVIIGTDGNEVYPVSHGSGFAVAADRIITNAHVVREALLDDTLTIAVVPSDGDEAEYARAVSVDPRTDLALLQITGDLRLPALTIAGRVDRNSGEVSAVGYPMNVDRAQGLEIGDIFKSQPPVKSIGYLAGSRPARQFDSVLHTAPIARGNSGGPLLDGCGRVVGINSFGADSDGSDAEFYFAVSIRELLPFLRKNQLEPQINTTPCRSLADLDAAERERMLREQAEARLALAARAEEQRALRSRAQLEAELEVQGERENAMALAFLLILVSIAAGFVAWQARVRVVADNEDSAAERRLMIAGTLSALALVVALGLWFTRPGIEEIDRRVAAAMQPAGGDETPVMAGQGGGTMICTIEESRSRITGARTDDVEFAWEDGGCVNDRTQYGMVAGDWLRVMVPDDEDAVSVNRYDPQTRTFQSDRYLLSRSELSAARSERGKYEAPKCGIDNAAAQLGDMQSALLAMLPPRPNERLVYSCEVRAVDSGVTDLATSGD
ncbi:S1C family serine protease [Altererythrobacter sp. MF3-039]